MRKLKEWLTERLIVTCGLIVAGSVGLVFLFLAVESKYAFDAEFAFGYRVVAESPDQPDNESVSFSPYASFVGAHPDGGEGLDEMELDIFAPSLDELAGVATAATGTLPEEGLDPSELRRDDWRRPTQVSQGHSIRFYAFATPEHSLPTIRLRWEADAGFLPEESPYEIKLRLVRSPETVDVEPFEVDLKKHPKGSAEFPAWVAKSDDERTQVYEFEVEARARPG